MTNRPAVGAVAYQETLKLDERYDGYRMALANALRELIKAQELGEIEHARRKRIEERINDLAARAMHGRGQG